MEKFKLPLRFLFLLLVTVSAVTASAQKIGITGTVSDSAGEPLIGVSVIVVGTPTGATTDIDGNYSINADAKSTLRFTYVGCATQDIAVDGH